MFYPFNHKNQRHQRAMVVEIENLAFACPYQEGEGVYLARYLYEQLNDTAYYYDDLYLCEEPMGKRDVNDSEQPNPTNIEESRDIKLWLVPNPAKETVDVLYKLKEDEQADLQLVDLLGQTLYYQKLTTDNGKLLLSLSEFSSGIYLIKTVGTKGSNLVSKLVIKK